MLFLFIFFTLNFFSFNGLFLYLRDLITRFYHLFGFFIGRYPLLLLNSFKRFFIRVRRLSIFSYFSSSRAYYHLVRRVGYLVKRGTFHGVTATRICNYFRNLVQGFCLVIFFMAQAGSFRGFRYHFLTQFFGSGNHGASFRNEV